MAVVSLSFVIGIKQKILSIALYTLGATNHNPLFRKDFAKGVESGEVLSSLRLEDVGTRI